MSHFESVGFAVGDYEEQKTLLSIAFDRASESGEVEQHADGFTATYRDPSGALFTLHKNLSGAFECGKPGFESRVASVEERRNDLGGAPFRGPVPIADSEKGHRSGFLRRVLGRRS